MPYGCLWFECWGERRRFNWNLWPRYLYAAPLPPAAFSQPPSDIRSGSKNSEGRRWLVDGRVGGVRAG
jgi:hypothetical protein